MNANTITRIGTKVAGEYPITAVIETGEYGWAVGYQMFGDKKLWCTWEYRTDSVDSYYWGHYMIPSEEDALRDMVERSAISPKPETIYREVDKTYRLEDAHRQVDRWLWENDASLAFDHDDYENLVKRFYDSQDCSESENDTWEYVIGEYVKEMQNKED